MKSLLFLLLSTTTAQDLISICGSDYNDALQNCTTNTPCPTGDGCSEDKSTCFALPADTESCNPTSESPTGSPVAASNSSLVVCGLDAENAKLNCGRLCSDGCSEMEACFNVLPEDCVAPEIELIMESPEVVPISAEGDFTLEVEAISAEIPEVYSICGLSFEAAAAGCESATPCTPGGVECDASEACFNVPAVNCTSNSTNVTITTIMETENITIVENTTSPTTSPIEQPSPTAPPVDPTHVFTCGQDYADAKDNCETNPKCPSGDGCDANYTCFAIPFGECVAAAAAAAATVATEPAGGTTPAAGTVAAGGTTPAAGTTPVFVEGTTIASATKPAVTTAAAGTTGAAVTSPPVANTMYCGESFEIAVQDCYTNTPCPSMAGCPQGQACFNITSECLAPASTVPAVGENTTFSTEAADQTTLAVVTTPATAEPSASPVTAAPTKMNTYFCGANYTDAEVSCDFDTACPGGFECPLGQTCFTGIQCPATAPAPDATVVPPVSTPVVGGTTTQPTLRGTATSSITLTSTSSTSGTAQSSTPATTEGTISLADYLVYKYCGYSIDDARNNCATNTPCVDGTECTALQTCFELDSPCGDVAGQDITGGVAGSPTVSPTPKPVFDPNITSFCGVDYNDAQDNCYYATPCPGNSNAECGDGETCFPGITTCEKPITEPPTPAVTVGVDSMGNETDGNVTMVPAAPSTSPTKKPTYEYDLSGFGESDSGRDGSGSVRGSAGVALLVGGTVAIAMGML